MADVPSSTDPERPEAAPCRRRRRRPVLVSRCRGRRRAAVLVVVFAVAEGGAHDTADTPLLDQAAPARDRQHPRRCNLRPLAARRVRGSCSTSSGRGADRASRSTPSWSGSRQQQASQETAGAELVGVVYNDEEAMRQFFADLRRRHWPVLLDPTAGINAIAFGVVKVPETWIIDPNGNVRARLIAAVTADAHPAAPTSPRRGSAAVSVPAPLGPWLAMAVIVAVVLVVASGHERAPHERRADRRPSPRPSSARCAAARASSLAGRRGAEHPRRDRPPGRRRPHRRRDPGLRRARLGERYLLTPSSAGSARWPGCCRSSPSCWPSAGSGGVRRWRRQLATAPGRRRPGPRGRRPGRGAQRPHATA